MVFLNKKKKKQHFDSCCHYLDQLPFEEYLQKIITPFTATTNWKKKKQKWFTFFLADFCDTYIIRNLKY